MDMVGHQHVRVDVNRFCFSTLRKLAKEVAAVAIGEEDRTPVDAAQNDVHRVSGDGDAGASRHRHGPLRLGMLVGMIAENMVCPHFPELFSLKTWSVPISPFPLPISLFEVYRNCDERDRQRDDGADQVVGGVAANAQGWITNTVGSFAGS